MSRGGPSQSRLQESLLVVPQSKSLKPFLLPLGASAHAAAMLNTKQVIATRSSRRAAFDGCSDAHPLAGLPSALEAAGDFCYSLLCLRVCVCADLWPCLPSRYGRSSWSSW